MAAKTALSKFQAELEHFRIHLPTEVIEKLMPPPPISIASLSHCMQLPLDSGTVERASSNPLNFLWRPTDLVGFKDVLSASANNVTIKLRVTRSEEALQFAYMGPNVTKYSTSPFTIIRDSYKEFSPSVDTQGRGWNAISYKGRTLVWWRKKYLLAYVESSLVLRSPKIKALVHRPMNPTTDTCYHKPITLEAEVACEDDLREVLQTFPELTVRVNAAKITPECGFAHPGSKLQRDPCDWGTLGVLFNCHGDHYA